MYHKIQMKIHKYTFVYIIWIWPLLRRSVPLKSKSENVDLQISILILLASGVFTFSDPPNLKRFVKQQFFNSFEHDGLTKYAIQVFFFNPDFILPFVLNQLFLLSLFRTIWEHYLMPKLLGTMMLDYTTRIFYQIIPFEHSR